MTHKIGSTPPVKSAAYLLFYRRRSDKPLGPQYLQDIVSDFMNPSTADTATEDAEESDSGEGKLGGPDPSSIRLGSSSNFNGAGVGAANRGGSGGTGAGNSLSRKLTTMRNDEDEGIGMDDDGDASPIGTLHGKPLYGPQRPAHLREYGEQGTASWGFDGLDNQADGSDAEMLLDKLENNDDNASTAAELDSNMGDSRMNDDFYQDATEHPHSSPIGWNDPNEEWNYDGYNDDHTLYSGAHDPESLDALHLEDAGTMGGGQSPEAVDIELPEDSHAKMD